MRRFVLILLSLISYSGFTQVLSPDSLGVGSSPSYIDSVYFSNNSLIIRFESTGNTYGIERYSVVSDTFYVATDGDDSGAGTIGDPFLTWGKLADVLEAGDVGYIRGGTYDTLNPSAQYQCDWRNLQGTGQDTIKIYAYPGETPVWDLQGKSDTTTKIQPFAIQMYGCDYVHVKGLTLKYFAMMSAGLNTGLNLTNSNHCLIEQVVMDSIEGNGFSMCYEAYGNVGADTNTEYSTYNTFLNCDAVSCNDPLSVSAYDNAQGFSITHNVLDENDNNPWALYTTFRGCRAWLNSDDGFEVFLHDGYTTIFDSCWAFLNGYRDTLGNTYSGGVSANGFKLGKNVLDRDGINLGTMQNCLAVYNTAYGVYRADAEDDGYWNFYNNFFYANTFNGILMNYGYATNTHVLRNNLSYKNDPPNNNSWSQWDGADNWDNDTFNIWLSDGSNWNTRFTQTDADFVSLDSSQLWGPRQSNGSLPIVTFGHLQAGSDLINGGEDVGLSYEGTAPDLGAFEKEWFPLILLAGILRRKRK